jgi:hypothetical protein
VLTAAVVRHVYPKHHLLRCSAWVLCRPAVLAAAVGDLCSCKGIIDAVPLRDAASSPAGGSEFNCDASVVAVALQ